MTHNATKTYEVTVIDRFHAHYRVHAADARAAAENWGHGEFKGRDDEPFDDEGPCAVRERQTYGTWREVPPSEWAPAPDIARFDNFEIEPRIAHWEDGDPRRPDHIICEEHEADLWRLCGTRHGQDSVCIGEYATRALAEDVYAGITGRRYGSP